MSGERRVQVGQSVYPATTPSHLQASQPRPSIGRVVHYHSFGTPGGEYLPEARAAVITEVKIFSAYPDPVEVVGLAVLNPTGLFFNTDVHFSPTPKPGHWSWPPRT